jgi:sulfate adenylyltransferase subunit 1
MVTGASTANAALILIDARHGVIEQTKRHAFIASLLQIPHIIVCINKMDLVDYSEDIYENIIHQFEEFSSKLYVKDIQFLPISALDGDNVVNRSTNMDWYQGAPLLHTLETMHISSDINKIDARFPVQTVLRPQREGFIDYRGYAGRVASGIFRPGDDVVVMPSGFTSKIKSIDTMDGSLEEVFAPMSVAITLEDDIDISRGDMIVKENNQPKAVQEFDAMLCWFNNSPARERAKYTIMHNSNEQKAMIKEVVYKIDINTYAREEENKDLKMNDIARISIRTTRPLMVDEYRDNRITGSFVLIDDATHETVAAGMIV